MDASRQEACGPAGPGRPALLVALAVTVAISLWPVTAGLRAANDDIKWVRTPVHEMPLADAIADAWRSGTSFRPLEVTVAHFADATTLTCWLAVAVQAIGLALLLAGVVRLCGECFPRSRTAAIAAVCFMAVSPATTVSAWQLDCCSQTWTAALGIWATVACWKGLRQSAEDSVPWRPAAILAGLFVAGCTIKENFYGWSAGMGAACLAVTAVRFARDRPAAVRTLPLVVSVVVIPMAHLAARFALGSLQDGLGGDGSSRYHLELGANVVLNAALSLAGIVGVGPFHLTTDDQAAPWLRFSPHLAVAAAAFLALGVGLLAVMGSRTSAPGARWKPLLFAGTSAIGSLLATIPMGSVSELYGMGANAWVAVAIGGMIALLWDHGAPDERMIARTVAIACTAAITAIGGYGLASRALHFRAVWCTTDRVNAEILAFQDGLEPSRDPSAVPAGVVHFPLRCMVVRTYGQYVMPAAQAIGSAPATPTPRDLVVDCGGLPEHGHW